MSKTRTNGIYQTYISHTHTISHSDNCTLTLKSYTHQQQRRENEKKSYTHKKQSVCARCRNDLRNNSTLCVFSHIVSCGVQQKIPSACVLIAVHVRFAFFFSSSLSFPRFSLAAVSFIRSNSTRALYQHMNVRAYVCVCVVLIRIVVLLKLRLLLLLLLRLVLLVCWCCCCYVRSIRWLKSE